jgi:amino acid adenylation domain-containing protein
MTQRAHPLLPLIWSSASTSATQSKPVDLGLPAAGAARGTMVALTGLYSLLLRYGGVRDVTLLLRSSAAAPWRSLLVRDSAMGDGSSALGPTLGECQQALQAALGPRAGSADAAPPDFPEEGYEVAVPAAADEDEIAASASAPDDSVVFAFSRDARSGWSVSLRTSQVPDDPQAPARVLAHLASFARASVATPHVRVGEVQYLSAAERRLIDQLNDPPRALAAPPCIHQLVEEAARRYPARTAVIQGGARLTFQQLDEKANAIAAALAERGISRGHRVGILASRSAEFAVAALAVLKAGAAYVPIDPLLPAARLSTLFQIASVRLTLAEQAAREVAAGLTEDWMAVPPVTAIGQLPAEQFRAPAVGPRDLAYVIFTSGSSGIPKGVLLDHHGRVNLLVDLNQRLGIGPDDRTLVVASPSFDTSVLEIFGSLAAGAGIVLPERGREHDVGHWVELVRAENVTVWNSVPSTLTVFLRAWERAGLPATAPGPLRSFLLGGDWLPLQQPDWIWAAFPGAEVYAIGGNTEVSVCTTFYPVTSVRPDWLSIPYGRALTNQTVYVLDPFGQLAPPDLAGELAFGGVGVGWGYDAHPRLTAERFIPDPYGPAPGGRLYLTGDGARARPVGFVELLGRLDQQVKIEGVRIELGEIQTCLCAQPEVAEAVVVPRRGADSRVHSLVAFVVPAGPAAAAVTGRADGADAALSSALRARLSAELPRPMVPQRLVIMDSLPLNSNGKIDQRSLAALAAADASPVSRGRPGHDDEIVRTVAEVWAEVLGLDDLPGADAVFADLGGGSLAAMQVASRLSTRFNAEVKVADLFATATASEVAGLVRNRQGTARPMPDLVRRRPRAAG